MAPLARLVRSSGLTFCRAPSSTWSAAVRATDAVLALRDRRCRHRRTPVPSPGMSRFLLIRDSGDSEQRLVPECAVPTEAQLHEVLRHYPELVPTTDLGLGRVVTVGFEAALASGQADLVLLDEEGRLAVIEVKKEGNPDTRRVVAQLLDYAAALWGLTLEEFDRHVLRRLLDEDDPRSLREFVVEELHADADDADGAAERTLNGLSRVLATGEFALVLAAPSIPPAIERVIAYLNARGLSVFGLELSYFSGGVEAFVPRIVIGPGPPSPAVDTGSGHRGPWNWDSVLAEIASTREPEACDAALALMQWAKQRGAKLEYGSGKRFGGVYISLRSGDAELHALDISTGGAVSISFSEMKGRGQSPFAEDLAKRDEFRERLREVVPNATIPPEKNRLHPQIDLSLLGDDDVRQRFLQVIEWALDEAKLAQHPNVASDP